MLEKFAGKGGWTYALIPEVEPDRKTWFNWVKVHGTIDGFEIKHARLMPMGNGQLFLPVKAAIRKAIGKEAGEWVHIVLFPDNLPVKLPQELIDCFELENKELTVLFSRLTSNQQQELISWIYEAKKEETKAKRILKVMNFLKDKYKI